MFPRSGFPGASGYGHEGYGPPLFLQSQARWREPGLRARDREEPDDYRASPRLPDAAEPCREGAGRVVGVLSVFLDWLDLPNRLDALNEPCQDLPLETPENAVNTVLLCVDT